MIHWVVGILALGAPPLVFLVLAKGFRPDRAIFAIYLSIMALSGIVALMRPAPSGLHWRLDLLVCGLPVLNGLMCMDALALSKKGGVTRLSFMLLPFSVFSAYLFAFQCRPEVLGTEFFIEHGGVATPILVGFVGAVASLTFCWERWAKLSHVHIWERLFRLGLILWWIVLLFFLSRLVFSEERAPLASVDTLLGVHLAWLLFAYPLILKKGILEVRARPSAEFLGRASQTLLVLLIVALFLWGEALVMSQGISRVLLEVVVLGLLVCVMAFPLVPSPPLTSVRRYLQQHLYLPERDFAGEVALYLRVMGGKEELAAVLQHLCACLEAKGGALYRHDRTGALRLQASWGGKPGFPDVLPEDPGEELDLLEKDTVVFHPLSVDTEAVGVLVLKGVEGKSSWEKESLLRFWCATLGSLLRELEWKEKEEERRKILSYSEATSFLIHDAKNLAQLLELILKNLNRVDPKERDKFLEVVLPGLEQARQRARKILEKLETFHPTEAVIQERLELVAFVKEWVTQTKGCFPEAEISFVSSLENAPWTGDGRLLGKILENLTTNAIQATCGKGPVELAVVQDRGGYLIEVRDWGVGVAEKDCSRLFEPLFTNKQGGSGLGLYQARILAERCGAKVGYRPNSPKGSIFYVRVDKDPACGG